MVSPPPENDDRAWVTANAAAKMLPGYSNIGYAYQAIVRHARAGLVAAKCRKASAEIGRTERVEEYGPGILPKEFFAKFYTPNSASEIDWVSGYFQTWMHPADGAPRTVYAYGVEFCRGDIEHIVEPDGELQPSRQPARHQPRASTRPDAGVAKVDRADLRAWVSDFGARNPGASFRVILTNARLAFPGRHVAELPVKHVIAELNLNLSPGNPRITQKNR